MCRGVLKVTTLPATLTISLTSAVTRSWRENQLAASPLVGVVGMSGSSPPEGGAWGGTDDPVVGGRPDQPSEQTVRLRGRAGQLVEQHELPGNESGRVL